MAYILPTTPTTVPYPHAVRIFFKRRAASRWRASSLFIVLIAAGVALATWSVDDPSLNHAIDGTAANWLGYPGAVLADRAHAVLRPRRAAR